jgi:tRNA(Ile)-lysidine synthase
VPSLGGLDLDDLFAPVAGANKLGLAVSGGPDSLALMLLAREWASAAGRPQLIVYSVDHGLRPEASDEVSMVRAAAQRLGLLARGLRWDGDKPETGIQASARKARYDLMGTALGEDGGSWLLTAHHLGDQAETVMMRLAHGSGIEGLRGMDEFATVEGCRIFRPLLGIEPDILAEIVEEAGLTSVTDPSNRDRHYERVRWRQLMPQLEELGLDLRRLGHFAARMGDADELIAAETERALADLVHFGPEGDAEMPHGGLAKLHRVVAVRLLGRVLRRVGGEKKPHALGAIETLHARLAGRQPLKAGTLHGCIIQSDGTTVSIKPEPARRSNILLTTN